MGAAAENAQETSGLPAAIGAYLLWGFLPLYLLLVREVPAFEFVGWRIIWTVPICLVLIALRRQWPQVKAAIADRQTLGWLFVSAALIGANWLTYIWAIQANYVYAASMGYYLNPMLNVLLGTVFLGEKLSRRQWVAVAIASASIASLLFGALSTLWISLSLAGTFGFYGLVRKQTPVGAVPGLTIESILLLLPSFAIVWWYASSPAGASFGKDAELSALIMLGGIVTAVPLLLFAIAARKLPYSTLGFIQFLAPTIVFFLGLTVFEEKLELAELGAFILIWIAIAIFVSDLFGKRSAPEET
ncbi:EamA family transporter RarD [Altererythrobacter sp. GH1-8]|uniref:EamA family transporter RarD n=1 Tax=Altererythrobacter sp. GH1-8 TaxID=3349333 RepID=UPI00374DEE66